MAIFTENDLRYSYRWNPETVEKLPKKIRFKDTMELDIEEGYEVLLFINSYMQLKNLGMKCTFEKIERILKEELPETKRGLSKAKRFLTENYFF
jgi:flagellar motor component MotA